VRAILSTIIVSILTVAIAEVVLTLALKAQQPIEFPFHNVLYPYVEFRPPANTTWQSDSRSPSSRTSEFAVEYTNQDSLRIPSPSYLLEKRKPPCQLRIGLLGGSTVRIGTRFEVTLPGALKRALRARHPTIDFEVINAGIISAISRQELVFFLTTLVDYEIDMLLTYDGINDSGQMLYYERRPNFPYNYRVIEEAWFQYVNDRRLSLWRQILGRSAILRFLWPTKFGDHALLDRVAAAELFDNSALARVYAEAHVDNWERIRRVCTAYDIRPVFVLQPTSLYAIFQDGKRGENRHAPFYDNLYANYVVYEELRKTTRRFSQTHPHLGILDLSSFLPLDAFFDGAHVYDDMNDTIAEKLADLIERDIQILKHQRERP